MMGWEAFLVNPIIIQKNLVICCQHKANIKNKWRVISIRSLSYNIQLEVFLIISNYIYIVI